jgi:hypothetical protein
MAVAIGIFCTGCFSNRQKNRYCYLSMHPRNRRVSATLEPGLKAVLCLDMLMGRVEVIAFLVLLYPRSWFGRKRG